MNSWLFQWAVLIGFGWRFIYSFSCIRSLWAHQTFKCQVFELLTVINSVYQKWLMLFALITYFWRKNLQGFVSVCLFGFFWPRTEFFFTLVKPKELVYYCSDRMYIGGFPCVFLGKITSGLIGLNLFYHIYVHNSQEQKKGEWISVHNIEFWLRSITFLLIQL